MGGFLHPSLNSPSRLEPTTPRLTAECSTIELSRNMSKILFKHSKKGTQKEGFEPSRRANGLHP